MMTDKTTPDCTLYIADVTPLENSALFSSLYVRLSAERRRKIDRYRLEKDKRLSLGVGVLLNCALDTLGIPSADREIAYTAQGKPYLLHNPSVFFNLSHAGTKVLCAVADRPVGCDIEPINRQKLSVAKRFFTADENAQLDAVPDCCRAVLFTRLWVLKESFLKVTGQGLSLPMTSFSFVLPTACQSQVTLTQCFDNAPYGCYEYGTDDGYRYACILLDDREQCAPTRIPIDLSNI